MVALHLERLTAEACTSAVIGDLTCDGVHLCYTLENSLRVIPTGAYKILFTKSPKFSSKYPYNKLAKSFVPVLCSKEVSINRGIRIHCGCNPQDSEGCILLGNEIRCADTPPCEVLGLSDSWDAYINFMKFICKENPFLQPMQLKITQSPDFNFPF